MKIIHTADIHLDSPLSQVADSAARRYELLRALKDMAQYADNNGVSAIIVAGDLFDDRFASAQTVSSVAQIINDSSAEWFVLQGNHGSSEPYVKLKNLAPKLNLFSREWTYYDLDNVTICGRELGVNDREQYSKLNLNPNRYNVAVLHGDLDDERYGLIDKKAIAQSNINYVALGHRHALSEFRFGKVKACYCGVLEVRGFDEPEKTGFAVIDTDKDEIKFVEQHIRRIENITVDVTGVKSDIALQNKIADAVSEVNKRNYLNFTLVGELNGELHLEMVANSVLAGKFFALRIQNAVSPSFDLAELAKEVSLRGEFVKLACKIENEKMRSAVLKMGLQALNGEDIE